MIEEIPARCSDHDGLAAAALHSAEAIGRVAPLLLYGVATMVVVSRMYLDAHWARHHAEVA